MKSISPLCDTDIHTVNDADRQNDTLGLCRRAHVILPSHKSYPLNQISEILDVTRPTVSIWLDTWKAEGLKGLID